MKIELGNVVIYRDAANVPHPAMVVRVWNNEVTEYGGTVNLSVFLDGSNDGNHMHYEGPQYNHPMWKTSVSYSDRRIPNTWHFLPVDKIEEPVYIGPAFVESKNEVESTNTTVDFIGQTTDEPNTKPI